MDYLYYPVYSTGKKYTKFYILILIITIIVVAVSVLIAINIVNKRKNPYEADKISTDIVVDNEVIVPESANEKLPVLTDKGKDNISNIYKSTEKIAYLTFDDGPNKVVTSNILDILKEQNVKATFFVLGSRVDLYPSIVKREYEEGHYIANHGYSHVYKNIYASAYAVLDEYSRTETSIREAIQVSEYNSHLFRFPGGSVGGDYKKIKTEAINILSENNIAHVDWNALTNDSMYAEPNTEILLQKLRDTIANKNAVVILMHDSATKQITADILPDVINILRESGYCFRSFYDVIE